MNSLRGRRDPRTGRVCGFQSETQRENFMIGRARFCNGPNREMPRCSALNRLGEPCKAARMRGRSTCFRHSGSAAAKRARLAAAHLSGDVDRIQRAEMRAERNRLRSLWRRDPREPGRTIVLVAAMRRPVEHGQRGRAFSSMSSIAIFRRSPMRCRWIWARMSRGLISDDDLAAKLARLRNRIAEASRAFDHSG